MGFEKVLNRISYHVIYDSSIMEALEFAANNNFSGIQLAMDSLHLGFENLSEKEIEKIRRRSEALKIRIDLHAPDGASLLYPYSKADKGIMSYYSDLIEFAKKIGARIITIHPGVPAHFPTDTEPPQLFAEQDIELYRHIFKSNLDKLLELADGKVQICIENVNLQPFVIETLEDYVKRTDLGLCWDFEKMHNKDHTVNLQVKAFILRNLAAVKQVHLHSIANGKSHRIIQSGLIDFKYYLGLLSDFDVLDYCIEVRPREKAVESLDNLKKILSVESKKANKSVKKVEFISKDREKITAKAYLLITNRGKLLVHKVRSDTNQSTSVRPPGGHIEYGEFSKETARREMMEEMGDGLKNVELIGSFENIFKNLEGSTHHEIIFVYKADLAKGSNYSKEIIEGIEDNGIKFELFWVSINNILSNKVKLVPKGFETFLKKYSATLKIEELDVDK